MTTPRDRARVLAPPPVLTLLCIVAGITADNFLPLPLFPPFVRIAIGVVFLIAALALFLTALAQFAAWGEHPSPYQPTNRLLTTGVYSRTRNPIYVAMLLVVIAVAGFANSGWLFASLVLLFVLLHFGVVKREEEYLAAKFGSEYEDYRRRVRRWI